MGISIEVRRFISALIPYSAWVPLWRSLGFGTGVHANGSNHKYKTSHALHALKRFRSDYNRLSVGLFSMNFRGGRQN